MKGVLRFALYMLAAALPSCSDEGPVVPAGPPAECRPGAETALVWGPWKLDISGVHEHCDEERQNGAFEIRPSLELEVAQRAESETPGVESLRLARSVEGFHFTGSVEGECVRFELSEEKTGGAAMAFSGVAGQGEIAGEFRGNGPGACTSSGSFAARFRQAAVRR